MPFRVIAAVVIALVAHPAGAQIQMRPTEPPLVTAANESWYLMREPIQLAGDLYYPAGPAVYFDGNVMVRTGHYNGVPIYMDATIEPYSVVLVPIRRGLMQPYERRRQGDLVGTTGSRTPAFPVGSSSGIAGGRELPQAAVSPTQPQIPGGAISVYTPAPGTVVLESNEPMTPMFVPTPATASNLGAAPGAAPAQTSLTTASLLRPENNDGIWIQFKGEKWIAAGTAIPLRADEFKMVGEYSGFPVFIRSREGVIEGDRIYLPTRPGLVAPYRMK
jgi:hypothetical protein